jgi:RNA polymerase subunit RPABC4/transcription elongation factor Spt4
MAASILVGLFGYSLLSFFVSPSVPIFVIALAFILFAYGLLVSISPRAQHATAPPPPPAPHAASVVTICPQCRSTIAADANYCPKCGADTRARAKEIMKEKEVIVKIRCAYCNNLYNETLDKCPHCGAKRS